MQMTRSMYYYRSRIDPQTALRQRIREIAHARVRFGYRRVYIMLRREGWDVGKDRFYRVYREENLGLRRKRPWRHVSSVHRQERRPASRANEVWGMDFVADELANGRKIRTLTIVDLFTRECLGIEVGFSMRAEHVVAVKQSNSVTRPEILFFKLIMGFRKFRSPGVTDLRCCSGE